MPYKGGFKQRIEDVRRQKEEELRAMNVRRDILSTKFTEAWRPLIEHVEVLGKRHLPPGVRLSATLSVNHDLRAQLSLLLEKQKSIRAFGESADYWTHISHADFVNRTARNFKAPGRLGKLFRQAVEPDLALSGSFLNNDAALADLKLDPKNMFAAKTAIGDWLATYIAFDFDYTRLHPQSESSICVTRKGAYHDPRNEP